VEACDRADDPARLAARYFAADERDGDAADVAWRWTAKEALMKAAGMTLRAALATSMGPRAAAPFVREIAGATLTVLAPIEGYACAVATAPR
jgi:phosphopantetheinyl transferase